MELEKILNKANELGHLLQQHEIVRRFRDLSERLERNQASRQLLEELAERAQVHEIKLRMGHPIEPDEKRRLAELEEQVEKDALIREFLATQGYYLHLMAQVNEAVSRPTGEPPRESSIILPGQSTSGLVLP